jgi:crotonobetainyl-CoA:carnitine CoA-transferase CaiB-like acyl-CoA transferase
MQPLDGLLVLDFSTLVPGPLATLLLAEAGATVVKIERPGGGDEMRAYEPRLGPDSVNFVMLNRGKQSLEIDLKASGAIARLGPLLKRADVLVEQFRPGVMDRLGLGYDAVRAMNRRLVYCSITGWGQSGPKSGIAAHDLNYMAETGILGLSRGSDGSPALPSVLAADIAGGAYPAVMNILLALRQRDQTGVGCCLDIAMGENLFTLAYWALGEGLGADNWPQGGDSLVTGGSPRYRIYRTADGQFLAAAPVEDRFWKNFCDIVELPEEFRGSDVPADKVVAKLGSLIAARSADAWRTLFDGSDVCCSIAVDLRSAMEDPHFLERRVFARMTETGGCKVPALPVPVAQEFRSVANTASVPRFGEDGALLAAK